MDEKIKLQMEDRLSRISDYVEDVSKHLALNHLEEVEYYIELIDDEVKRFIKDLNNAFNIEESNG